MSPLRLVALSFLLLTPTALAEDWERRLADFEKISPDIDEKAPAFSLRRIQPGEPVTLASLLARGPVVVEFVCLSSPEACDQGDRAEIRKAYSERGVQFVLVYVREEAGDGLSEVAQPQTMDARLENARAFRTKYAGGTEVLVDPTSNATWKDYGRLPNSMFVIAPDGTVVFRDAWASADSLRAALGEVYAGGFDKLKPEPDPKNLAARDDKKPEDGADAHGGRDKPDRPDRNQGGAQEWEAYKKRGEKIVEVAKQLGRFSPSDRVGQGIYKAGKLAEEARRAAEQGNWAEAERKWTEYKQYVERLEKELGIVPEEGKKREREKDKDNR